MKLRIKRDRSFLESGKYRNIGVTGITAGVGTTFTATGLAYYLAYELGKDVCFTQCCLAEECTDLIYYTLGVDKRGMETYGGIHKKSGRGYDSSGRYNSGSLVDNCWIDGINWRVISPSDLKCKSEEFDIKDHTMDLICKAKGDVNVFDIDWHDSWNDFCDKMDLLIVVLDPMPSRLLRAADRILQFKIMEDRGISVAWILNRSNRGISKRQVREFIRERHINEFPLMDYELICALEYKCLMPKYNIDIWNEIITLWRDFSFIPHN